MTEKELIERFWGSGNEKPPQRKLIVFRGAAPHAREMLDVLHQFKGVDVHVVAYTLDDSPLGPYPDNYDWGINFLGTHKIPSDQLYDKEGKHRWLNFHPAPLPDIKGRNVAYNAIMEGYSFFGATLHWMDENFDTGPIIAVDRFGLDGSETAGELMGMSIERLKKLFRAWVPYLLSYGSLEGNPQVKTGRYYPKEKISNEIQLSEAVHRQIRAKMVFPKYLPEVIIQGRKFLIIPEEAWSEYEPKPKAEPKPKNREEQFFCENCKADTLHFVIDSDHERDSSGDYRKCLTCHWTYTGLEGEYLPPSFDL